ncbi:MAG: DUF2834 domain-containing protein [Pseudomonadota bacterium]
MSLLRMVYLALAVAGAILPMKHFIVWFNENGYSLYAMTQAWNVNSATTGLVWDLTIAAIALTVWIIAEVLVRRDYWVAPVCILATFCIGVSCGLPLYLFLRTRKPA